MEEKSMIAIVKKGITVLKCKGGAPNETPQDYRLEPGRYSLVEVPNPRILDGKPWWVLKEFYDPTDSKPNFVGGGIGYWKGFEGPDVIFKAEAGEEILTGQTVKAVVSMSCAAGLRAEVVAKISAYEGVEWCSAMKGRQADVMAFIEMSDEDAVDTLVSKIQTIAGVFDTQTSIAVE